MIMMAAVSGVAVIIQLVMVPLRHVFVTVMYGDQLRRHQLGPVNHAFAMNMPGYAPQGYGYPQAGYGYPQTGPQPGYGDQPGYGAFGRDLYGDLPSQPPYGPQPPYGQQPGPGTYGQSPRSG